MCLDYGRDSSVGRAIETQCFDKKVLTANFQAKLFVIGSIPILVHLSKFIVTYLNEPYERVVCRLSNHHKIATAIYKAQTANLITCYLVKTKDGYSNFISNRLKICV